MERQTITVDITPEGYAGKRLKVSQFDVDRPLGVYIEQDGEPLDCSAYTAQLFISKPDKTRYERVCTIDGNLVMWETKEQETIVAGICIAEIRITDNGRNVGTANFTEWVEESSADLNGGSHSESQSLIDLVKRAEEAAESAEGSAALAIHSADLLQNPGQRIADALERMSEDRASRNRVITLDATPFMAGEIIDAVGIPTYVSDVSQYSDYGLTDTGWYVFARIFTDKGVVVTEETAIIGASGCVMVPGEDHIDVAIKFEVAAQAKTITIAWNVLKVETFTFRAADLAVRNLDYRSTFYVYDIGDFVTWAYILTTDTTFVITKAYYMLVDGEYVKAPESVKYALTADTVFVEGKTYYTEADGVYTAATVTVGEEVPADTYYELAAVTADTYYVHSKLTIAGMIRNVTYRLNEMVDCPIEIVLPTVPDDGYGAWFEIQMQFDGSYSVTLLPTDTTVKIGTAQTQGQTAGINVIDLQYSDVNGIKMWTLLNTHSNLPTT